jgi:hypothetical protein
MKNYFILLVYTFLFISCDPPASEEIVSDINNYSKKYETVSPVNLSNAYEFVGQVYADVLDSYYADPYLPKDADSIIEKVNLEAHKHVFFDNLPLADYNLIPQSRISYLVSDGEVALDLIVSDSSLPLVAKENFRSFVSTVLSKVDNEEDYTAIYNYVILYESTIQDAVQLSPSEKEYLLTVTSIIRHSVYARKKRPKKNTDLDWYWLTAKFSGALEGAQHGQTHAILTALKAGIMTNK